MMKKKRLLLLTIFSFITFWNSTGAFAVLSGSMSIERKKVVFPETKLAVNLQSDVQIKGKVVDEFGDGLPGVNVRVKGTETGTITDMDGNFMVTVPYANASLIFSYVGFQPETIDLKGRTNVSVTLKEDSKALEEVVVVGYSTQKKITITGSVATITTKDLRQSPTANLNNALAGRMPGLFVNQFAGGEPGVDGAEISVRGMSTYGDKNPIVIVDGVERSMEYLAPEEIETFTILKDAASTAAYGVRGANGVILITTKRGKAEEKATVNFKASFGINNPVKFPQYLGSADYAELYNEAMINDGTPIDSKDLFTQDVIDNFRMAKGDNSDGLGYDWNYFDYAFKPGFQQDYSLSVRGGSNKARYYVMANYYNQSGNYKHTDLSKYESQANFKRYNFRTNIDVDITKNFYVKLDLGAHVRDRTSPGTTASRIINICNTQPPYLPITLEDNGNEGNSKFVRENPLGLLYGDRAHRYNLLGELSRNGYESVKRTSLTGSFTIGHKLDFITKGLKIEGIFTYDADEGRSISRTLGTRADGNRTYGKYATFMPSGSIDGNFYMRNAPAFDGIYEKGNPWYTQDETMGNGFAHKATQNRTYYQLKLNYDRKFGNHDINAMVLFNRSSKEYDADVLRRYQGLASRVAYNYKNKYLAEFNIGYNGSENFAKGHRYGVFPAGSIGWIISEEPFMNKAKGWLDKLKFRASFGQVGSDLMPGGQRFTYIQYYNNWGTAYFGLDSDFNRKAATGWREGDMANLLLCWEKVNKLDLGIDGNMFDNRLTFSIDYFREHRFNILTSSANNANKVGYPDYVGTDAPLHNMGIVNNQGIDAEIGWRGRVGKDFHYWIKPNVTFARNKVIFMDEVRRDHPWRAETGRRIGEHMLYVFDHFVEDQAEADRLNAMNHGGGFQPWGKLQPGDVVYKDLDGDGRIDNLGDKTAVGNPRTPELQFGIPFGFQYKGFDLSVMFQGAALTSVLLSGPAVYDFPTYESDQIGRVKPMHLNRWTEATKETAEYPRLTITRNENNKNGASSLFLYNASYLRLKNLEIGYTLPKSAIRFAGLQNVRFYVQGMNLLTIDGLGKVDIDPETKSGDGSWYPIQRIFNFGVDITY